MSNDLKTDSTTATAKVEDVKTDVKTETKTDAVDTTKVVDAVKTDVKADSKTDVKADATKTTTKAADDKTETDATVVKYDLKLPDGSLLPAARVEEIVTFAKERGLSNENAQAVLERENQAVAQHVEGAKTDLKEKSVVWVKELEADKEFGGTAFKENAELSKRFLKKFADEETLDALDSTGLGNHPGLFKMMVRAAKSMAEDKFIHPNSAAPVAKSIEDRLYKTPQK